MNEECGNNAGTMTSVSEKRRYPRQKANFLVDIENSEVERLEITSIDISEGGLGISVSKPLEIGRVYDFALLFEDARVPVKARGRIIWQRESDDGLKMGVQFEEIAQHDLDRIFLRVNFNAIVYL